jgi:alkanesulfonate monooxygenase SsuD/methylene tetrahydromethanopterin reductase-like flavin-dependent oxidoreductase (luciferase family)
LDVLFRDPRPEFRGRFYEFPPSGFEPKPVQQPRPPLLVGGFSAAAMRRCAEVGDGWFGASQSPDEAAAIVADLQRRRAELGRDPLEITLLTGWGVGFDRDLVERYEAAGVDRLMVTPWTSSRSAREGIERFASEADLA